MIRIAAIGDVHFSEDSRGRFRESWGRLSDVADVLLVAGDLTTHGATAQARIVAEELAAAHIPVVAVLGNHDLHCGEERGVRRELERHHVVVLDDEAVTLDIGGETFGVAGSRGFGGGFAGACATAFGEPEMKAFVQHTEAMAAKLQANLEQLDTDYRVALLHYAPVADTLEGERLEIYPFLGSYLLGEAIDDAGADLVVHGHAHQGTEKGITPGGVLVRNVALPVLRQPYGTYHVERKARLKLHASAPVPLLSA